MPSYVTDNTPAPGLKEVCLPSFAFVPGWRQQTGFVGRVGVGNSRGKLYGNSRQEALNQTFGRPLAVAFLQDLVDLITFSFLPGSSWAANKMYTTK